MVEQVGKDFNFKKWLGNTLKQAEAVDMSLNDNKFNPATETWEAYEHRSAYERYNRGKRKNLFEIREGKKKKTK